MPRATYTSALDGGATTRAVIGDVVVVVCVVGDIVGEVDGVQVPGNLQQQLFDRFERSHGVIISSVAWSGIIVG